MELAGGRPARDYETPARSFDYVTVGHVTVDVLADGSRRLGGSALYSALQAARLGQRALIVTKGLPREIEQLVEPYRGELELEIFPALETTTLGTSGSGATRRQRLLAWAGPIAEQVKVDTQILHLAPVARETPRAWQGRAGFVGLTPQGLVRGWNGQDRQVSPAPLDSDRFPDGCDAIVLSEHERALCAGRISTATEAGSVVAVTAGANSTEILLPGGEVVRVEVPAIEDLRDDLGAGDVFAAAFFVALHEGQPHVTAAAFANAAAAVRIGGAGADAIGDRAVVEARLRATTPA
jgi:pfkB family carbohydrate kinase